MQDKLEDEEKQLLFQMKLEKIGNNMDVHNKSKPYKARMVINA